MKAAKPLFLRWSLPFFALPALVGCGKTVPPPADPPVARRSADEILLSARLSPDVAPRAAFEVHRLDAFAACSAAQVRFEGSARVRAATKASSSGPLIGGIVIGGLGLVGGITTTALAASLKAPPFPSTPPPPDAELPSVDGKTGVIVAGVVTGVAVVGAAVITVLLVSGGSDDDDKKKRPLPPVVVPLPAGLGSVGGVAGGVAGGVGGVGGAVGGVGGAVGGVGGAVGGVGSGLLGRPGGGVSVQGGVTGPSGAGASGQVGLGGSGQSGVGAPGLPGFGGGAGGGARAGGSVTVQPVANIADIAARLSAFRGECPDDPAEGALAACTDKARILRLSCSAGH